jgi:hypothetical protein
MDVAMILLWMKRKEMHKKTHPKHTEWDYGARLFIHRGVDLTREQWEQAREKA